MPFVGTRPVWLLWHSHAHTVCTHQVWTICRLNALTCSGNALCWCYCVTCGRDQVNLNNSCIKVHYSARSEQCLYFNQCDGDVSQCDHDLSFTRLLSASNIIQAIFRFKRNIYCCFTIFIHCSKYSMLFKFLLTCTFFEWLCNMYKRARWKIEMQQIIWILESSSEFFSQCILLKHIFGMVGLAL